MLGSTRKGIERKKKTMLLHHCVNLNIAKDSGHLFEDDGQEIGKAKKGTKQNQSYRTFNTEKCYLSSQN